MNHPEQNPDQARPWYKEPWPWVIISIPGAAVVMGFITLYLALANPDYLVVEDETFREIKSEMRAQPTDRHAETPETQPGSSDDGEP